MLSRHWVQELYEELKRRRVIRVATLYIIAFWPIIQIVDILSPALNLPDSVMRYLVFAFVGGFPVVLILAWIFDINRGGIVTTSITDAENSGNTALIGGKAELLIIGILCLLVIGLFVVQARMDDPDPPALTINDDISMRTVGVLPFVSFSESSEDERFADGLTEELLNVLSRVKELRVAARTSSFAYKKVNKNVIEIGRELKVAVILEGSVRRNDIDDTIRVTAQLVETATGTHLWSKTYDREYQDIFKIQDDIAASVVDELQITLLGNDRQNIRSRSSASPEAMVANGMGQSELSRRTATSMHDAIRFFNKAIEQDPNYSDAYAGLATAYALLANYDYDPGEPSVSLAQEAIDQALALDPESGMAWAVQGLIQSLEMGNDAAKATLEKAMSLNPSYAMAVMWYASLVETQEEKLTWYSKAYELDPRSPVVGYNIANIFMDQGRDAEAMEIFARMVEADPYYPGSYDLAAKINAKRGRLDEAIAQYQRANELQPRSNYSGSIAELYVDLGDFEAAQQWIAVAAESIPEKYVEEFDWLRIRSLLADDRMASARSLLGRKIETARDDGASLENYLGAAFAAYILEDIDTVIWAFEKAEQISSEEALRLILNQSRYLEVNLAAAYAYKIRGNTEKAQQQISRIHDLIEQKSSIAAGIHSAVWYQQALLAEIEGNHQMALVHLQRAVDEGWRQHWRPGVEPIFSNLADELQFQSMMAGLQTRMTIMREQLTAAASFESGWSG
jgi:TolB-like protein/tetratricopeptide (TPR) repeat protein